MLSSTEEFVYIEKLGRKVYRIFCTKAIAHLVGYLKEAAHRFFSELGLPKELHMMLHHLLFDDLFHFQLDSMLLLLLEFLEFDTVGADLHPIGIEQVVE